MISPATAIGCMSAMEASAPLPPWLPPSSGDSDSHASHPLQRETLLHDTWPGLYGLTSCLTESWGVRQALDLAHLPACIGMIALLTQCRQPRPLLLPLTLAPQICRVRCTVHHHPGDQAAQLSRCQPQTLGCMGAMAHVREGPEPPRTVGYHPVGAMPIHPPSTVTLTPCRRLVASTQSCREKALG